MGKFDYISERTLGMTERAGDQLRQIVPAGAGKWFRAGAKVGALRGGARVASLLVRRHPVALVAAAAGAGVLWYAAHQRGRRIEQEHARRGETYDGSARRIENRHAAPAPGATAHAGRDAGSNGIGATPTAG